MEQEKWVFCSPAFVKNGTAEANIPFGYCIIFRLQHHIEMNRINEEWTVVSGTMQTQAFLLLTQKQFGRLKRSGVYFFLIQKAKYWVLLEIL